MRIEALQPLNHKGRTVRIGEVVELEDEVAAKRLIEVKAAKEVKDTVTPAGANTKVIENKQIGGKENV